MNCNSCREDAVYRCTVCGRPLCGKHAQLRTVCSGCVKKTGLEPTVKRAWFGDKKEIGEMVRKFWGEEDQLSFGRTYRVSDLPAFVARVDGSVVGFVSTIDKDGAVLIVALGVLPDFQHSGVGRALICEVEKDAVRREKRVLLVSTSNDDLPALAFYQSIGFQIFDVKPNVVAKKHGRILEGIGGLPIRDELRLRKTLIRN